jgi:predicted kinase
VEVSDRPLVITFLGSIGVGKSFFARQLAAKTNIVRLNADAVRMAMFGSRTEIERKDGHGIEVNRQIFGVYDYVVSEILATKRSIILDVAQFNQLERRKELTRIADKADATVILVWIETPRETAMQRVQTRDELYDQRRVDEARARAIFEYHDKNFGEPIGGEHVIKISGTVPFEEQYTQYQQQLAVILKEN